MTLRSRGAAKTSLCISCSPFRHFASHTNVTQYSFAGYCNNFAHFLKCDCHIPVKRQG